MSDEKAKALGSRLARAADSYATKRALPRPHFWSEWFIVTVVWDGKAELEPTLLFPKSAPAGFELYARAALARRD